MKLIYNFSLTNRSKFVVLSLIAMIFYSSYTFGFAVRGNGGHVYIDKLGKFLTIDHYELKIKHPDIQVNYSKKINTTAKIYDYLSRSSKKERIYFLTELFDTISLIAKNPNNIRICQTKDFDLINTDFSYLNDSFLDSMILNNQFPELAFMQFYNTKQKKLTDFCWQIDPELFKNSKQNEDEFAILLLHEYVFMYENYKGNMANSESIRRIVQDLITTTK